MQQLQELATQASEEAKFGRALHGFPLSQGSLIHHAMLQPSVHPRASVHCAKVWYVPPTLDVALLSKKFVECTAWWRIWNYEGTQALGFLSNSARAEWDEIFSAFGKECTRIFTNAQNILDSIDNREDDDPEVAFDVQLLVPHFRRSKAEHYMEDTLSDGNDIDDNDVGQQPVPTSPVTEFTPKLHYIPTHSI